MPNLTLHTEVVAADHISVEAVERVPVEVVVHTTDNAQQQLYSLRIDA